MCDFSCLVMRPAATVARYLLLTTSHPLRYLTASSSSTAKPSSPLFHSSSSNASRSSLLLPPPFFPSSFLFLHHLLFFILLLLLPLLSSVYTSVPCINTPVLDSISYMLFLSLSHTHKHSITSFLLFPSLFSLFCLNFIYFTK